MRRTLFILFSFLVVSSLSINAQMKLNLSQELTGEQSPSLMDNNLESNLKLELPPEVTNPGNEFLKMWFVGLLADATFPLGDFGENWSTGFSAHAMFGYMIARSLLLNISVGYTTFGEKETVQNTSDHSFSWIPVLLGLNYVFNPGKKFMPYIGVALGLYFWSQTFNFTFFNQTSENTVTSTEFGVVPRLGAYYLVSAAILLSLSAEYNMIFTSGSTTSAFGVLFGAMFALH